MKVMARDVDERIARAMSDIRPETAFEGSVWFATDAGRAYGILPHAGGGPGHCRGV